LEEIKWFSSTIACQAGGVTVTPNCPTGFKDCKNCGLILWLSLLSPVLPGLLFGYGFSFLYSPGDLEIEAVDCFLLFSA
jgi:hypothetical protein